MWVAWLAMLHHKACDFSRGLFTYAPYVGGRVESFFNGFAHGVHDARGIRDVVVFEAG